MNKLDPAFYPALVDFGHAYGVDPEFLLRVVYLETRFDPTAHRSGSRYYGINQLDSDFLRKRGVDPEAYRMMPASEQLRLGAGPFWAQYIKGPIRSAGVMQGYQLAPARVGSGAPGNVLYRSGEAGYDGNKALDVNHDGAITVGDLDAFMEPLARQPEYQNALAELRAAGADTTPDKAPTAGVGAGRVVVAALGAGLLGAAAWMAVREGRGRRAVAAAEGAPEASGALDRGARLVASYAEMVARNNLVDFAPADAAASPCMAARLMPMWIEETRPDFWALSRREAEIYTADVLDRALRPRNRRRYRTPRALLDAAATHIRVRLDAFVRDPANRDVIIDIWVACPGVVALHLADMSDEDVVSVADPHGQSTTRLDAAALRAAAYRLLP